MDQRDYRALRHPFRRRGCGRYTTGAGNFIPRATLALYEAIEKEQRARTRRMQQALRPLEDIREEPGEGSSIPTRNNVPVIKARLDLAGYEDRPVRRPLMELREADRECLESHYERSGT